MCLPFIWEGGRKEHTTLIVTALYVPVVLYFVEQYLQKRELKWLFCCSGAMALQLLGGFLQYVIYADIAVFFYLLTSAVHHKFTWKRIFRDGILWIITYFGMCMAAILGTAQFMLFLSGASGSQMPFEWFIGLSLHPMKLLETVLPEIFGPDVGSALMGKGYSSGMDAELIMGAAAVCMLTASFALFRKRFHVRYMICLLFASLLYACMGNIPGIAKIFYHIPVLNLFRVPSRTLFLFTFASIVLIACSMEELNRNERHYQRLHIVNLCMMGFFVGAAILYSCAVLPYDGERLAATDVFFLPGVLFSAYLLVLYLGHFLRSRKIPLAANARAIVPVLVAGLMVVQVAPYYTAAAIKYKRKYGAS